MIQDTSANPTAPSDMPCKYCKNGWFDDQRFGVDVECVNGVLIDIDVATEGWARDVEYPAAPCVSKSGRWPKRDRGCQARLEEWASPKWVHVHSIDEMQAFYLSRLEAIRSAARDCGYAIGLHGSLRRDLDLIAVPWVSEHTDADKLAKAVQRAACGMERASYHWERKPAGRIAASFPICWTDHSMGYDTPSLGHIDLSVVIVENARV